MADDIRFTGLNLVCRDVEATMAFYRLLGHPFPDDAWRSATGTHHVSAVEVAGGTGMEVDSLALGAVYGLGDATEPATLVGFRVPTREAVDEVHDRLVEVGHPSRQPPIDAFWGARFAIVDDPDGRPVGLMSPQDRSRGTAPPDL